MKPNIGLIDIIVRWTLGAGIIFAALSEHISLYWYGIGFLVMLSGLMMYCPAYTVLGISTCGSNEKIDHCKSDFRSSEQTQKLVKRAL